MELLAVVAFVLLAVGVVGSVLPLVPGALASLAGVLVYWYATGFADPGPVVLVALVAVGLFATAVDYFGGAIAARAGGASALTTAAATVVGVVLLLVTGPVGLLVGVAGTVFALELYANRDARTSGRTALFATVGVLASGAVQVLLTASMLVVMVLVAVL
jgi:hypothetical protein